MMASRPDMEVVAEIPHQETVVAMLMFEGRLLVATQTRVYWLDGDILVPVKWLKERP